jgi:hypothetical protein
MTRLLLTALLALSACSALFDPNALSPPPDFGLRVDGGVDR